MRLAGGFLLAASAVFCGFYMSDIVEKRCRVLNECISLVRYISSLIEYSDEPIKKIMQKAASSNEYKMLTFLNFTADADISQGFEKVWSESIDMNNGKLLFSPKINELLKSFGNKLGKTDSAGQKELCNYYIKQFEILFSASNEKRKEQKRLCRVSGCAAALIFLVFVI